MAMFSSCITRHATCMRSGSRANSHPSQIARAMKPSPKAPRAVATKRPQENRRDVVVTGSADPDGGAATADAPQDLHLPSVPMEPVQEPLWHMSPTTEPPPAAAAGSIVPEVVRPAGCVDADGRGHPQPGQDGAWSEISRPHS